MKVVMLIVMFLLLGALVIISNGNLHLSDGVEREQFLDYYVVWMNSLFSNVKDLTANAVKLEWLPEG